MLELQITKEIKAKLPLVGTCIYPENQTLSYSEEGPPKSLEQKLSKSAEELEETWLLGYTDLHLESGEDIGHSLTYLYLSLPTSKMEVKTLML